MSARPNPLNALWNLPGTISQLVPRGAQSLTILALDGRWVKLLHVTGGRTIDVLLAHPIEGQRDEEIAAWLRQACAAHPFDPGTVLIANPSHLTTTRLFTLPSTDPQEIRDIVELQAEKHTPYAKEEILTDFRVLDVDQAGYSRVLLILSHQDIVHRALRLVEAMGWILERVGFELEGLLNWSRVAGVDTNAAVLIAELDYETTTLVILQGDRPYAHRSLAVGAKQLTDDPEEGPAKLIAEVQRTLETFDAEGFNLPVSAIVLTGQAARFSELKERVHQNLELPTTVIAAFEGCQLGDHAMDAQDDALSKVSFAGLAGLALRPSQVDLTPKALRLHRAFEARARALVGLGCQLIGCLLLVSCLIIGKSFKNERYYAGLYRQHQVLEEEAQLMERQMEQAAVIKGWLQNRGRLLNAIVELAEHTPPTILWDSLSVNAEQQLSLKGVSEEIPKVYDFANALKSSPRFLNVEARRVTKRKVGDNNVTEFEIVCSLMPPGGSDGDQTNPGG